MVLSKDLKIAIAFGLIIGAILSVCSLCFAAELEDVDFQVLNNANIGGGGNVYSYSGTSVYYFDLEPGYEYYLTPSFSRWGGTSSVKPYVGLRLDEAILFNGGQTYTFTGSGYLYISIVGTSDVPTLQRAKLEGLPDFVDNIAYYLSIGNLSSVWVLVVPILAISVLLGLGFYLLKRLLNRIKRAKGGA